jgi:hypothetical protein
VKTYIEEFLMTFSGFHQTVFSFLTTYSLQQLFPQLTAHSNFFHSHSPTKQTLSHESASRWIKRKSPNAFTGRSNRSKTGVWGSTLVAELFSKG